MKKQFLSMVALAGITLLGACSNDENVAAIDNGSNEVGTEIILALDSGGEGMATRAGRPVNSSAIANNVNKVQLMLYKNSSSTASPNWTEAEGVTFTDIVNGLLDWTPLATESVPGYEGTGRDTKKTVKIKGLSGGDYRLIAYGYENGYVYTLNAGDAFDAAAGMFKTDAITPVAGDNGNKVEEFFAGSVDFTADADGKLTTKDLTLTMKRQIAGLLGYFVNIPIHKANAGGEIKQIKYVIVRTAANANQFHFPHVAADGLNGYNQTVASTELLRLDLSALITSATGTNDQDYATQVASDTNHDKTFGIKAVTTGNVQKVANSVLAGRFIIPFSAHVTSSTLNVELADVDGNPVRSWNVKINKSNDSDFTGDGTTEYQYDILRNHFYSIGKKLQSDATEQPGSPDPTDPDTPVDLSQDNDIIGIVNDAWDVVYDMGLGN